MINAPIADSFQTAIRKARSTVGERSAIRVRIATPILTLLWTLGVAVPPPIQAEPANSDLFVESFQHAENTLMLANDGEALLGFQKCVELLEKASPDLRQKHLGIAEVSLRRLYELSSRLSAHESTRETFLRWAHFKEGPAEPQPELAAIARFFAGAATISTETEARAREIWAPLGFLERWSVIGPFDNERGTGFGTSFGPEGDARPQRATAHSGKARKVSWRDLPVQVITGWVNLDVLMRPNDQSLAYALTFIESDKEQAATLRLGTDESYRLWHNGELLASRDVHRRMRFDQDVLPLRLRKGWNTLLIKVAEEKGRWEFRARLTNEDGGPLESWREAPAPGEDADLPPTPAVTASAQEKAPTGTVRVGSPAVRQLQKRVDSGKATAQDYYLLGVLLQTIGAHDLLEHPDREAIEKAIEIHADPVPSSYHYHLAEASRRKVGVAADRDTNAWRASLEDAARLDKASLSRRGSSPSDRNSPPSLRARIDLARHYLRSFNNLIAAREFLETVLNLNPDATDARLLLGRVEKRQGFPRATERAHAYCRKRKLSLPRIILYEAERLRRRGDFADAEKKLRGLYARNRLASDTRYDLTNLLLNTGRVEEALTLLAEALTTTPFSTAIREKMVSILRGHGKTKAALAMQRQLVALTPDDHEARRDEGDLLWHFGRGDEAFAAWDAALEIQPNFSELREYVDVLRSRRDPFVDEFQVDVSEIVKSALESPPSGDSMAETLLDRSVVSVHVDGTVQEFHQSLVRVLNDRGVRAYDRFRTYFAEGNQRVEFKEGRVIHADGSIERARLQEFSGGQANSGEYRPAMIDLPPIEVGDLIEIQYVLEDVQQSFFGDYFGRRESFQSTLPTHEKTFILRVPIKRPFYFHYRNLDVSPTVERREGTEDDATETVTYTWTTRNIEKHNPEPGMPPRSESDPTLEISTFETWEDFSRWYWSLIRKQFEMSPEMISKVDELTEGLESRVDRIRALYDFVVQEIRYNAWEFGVHGFKPYNAPTIFARRFGDCKDKATLLTVMLGHIGIDAFPVLIKAVESRGSEDLTLPMVNHFNHCISYVPGGKGEHDLFLDGTATHNRLEELPSSDAGATVLVVRPEGSTIEQVPWSRPVDLGIEEDVQVRLGEDGGADMEIRGRALGDYGSVLRRHFEVAGNRKTLLEQIYGRRFAGSTVEDENFSDLQDLSEPVSYHLRLRIPDLLHDSPEGKSLNAIDDFFQSNRMLEGMGSLETRKTDIILGAPRRAQLKVTLHLPPTLGIKSVPKNRSVSNASSRLETRYDLKPDRVEYNRTLEITAPRIPVTSYERFRTLTTTLDRLGEENWILESRPDASN